MPIAVGCKSALGRAHSRTGAPAQFWCCLYRHSRFCQHNRTPTWQRLAGRHVSRCPAKTSKLQLNCMASDPQDGSAADSKTFMFLNSINDSAKWIVTLTSGGVLVWYHNVDVSWSLLGSIVTVFLCKVRSGPSDLCVLGTQALLAQVIQ